MNKKNKKSRTDWFGLFIFACLLFGAVVICYYLITDKINSCTSDTIKYLIKSVGNEQNLSYSYIKIYFYLNSQDKVPTWVYELDLNQKEQIYRKLPVK